MAAGALIFKYCLTCGSVALCVRNGAGEQTFQENDDLDK
jgi:hypothetical protein